MKPAWHPAKLRDRRLTLKPRILTLGKGFTVERMVPTSHPIARAFPQCKLVDTLEEAFATAHSWAGQKPQQWKL